MPCNFQKEIMNKAFKDEIAKLAAAKRTKKEIARDLAAGAGAGLVASYATYPIDTISNIKQYNPGLSTGAIVKKLYAEGKTLAQEGKIFPRIKTVSNVFKRYPSLGGASHFYGGAGIKIFKVAPYTALSFALYEAFKKKKADGTTKIKTK